LDRTVFVDQEMCREAHIYIPAVVPVGVLQENTEAVGQNIKIERRPSDIRIDLDLVVHRDRKENYVFVAVVFHDAVELWYLAVADRTSRRPKGHQHDLPLKLAQIIRLAIESLCSEVGSYRTDLQILLSESRDREAKRYGCY